MRDTKGRFTKGSGGSKDGRPGPRKPEQKARTWRRAVEKDMGGKLNVVEMAVLDRIEKLMARSFDGKLSTDDEFRLMRVLQELRKTQKPTRALTPMERWQQKQAQKSA